MTTKRRPAWVKKSGPYKCVSLLNGVIEVHPSWEQYGAVWSAEGGGGPGIAGRMGLASALEEWLNSPYTQEQIQEAHRRIKQHERRWRKAMEKEQP